MKSARPRQADQHRLVCFPSGTGETFDDVPASLALLESVTSHSTLAAGLVMDRSHRSGGRRPGHDGHPARKEGALFPHLLDELGAAPQHVMRLFNLEAIRRFLLYHYLPAPHLYEFVTLALIPPEKSGHLLQPGNIGESLLCGYAVIGSQYHDDGRLPVEEDAEALRLASGCRFHRIGNLVLEPICRQFQRASLFLIGHEPFCQRS